VARKSGLFYLWDRGDMRRAITSVTIEQGTFPNKVDCTGPSLHEHHVYQSSSRLPAECLARQGEAGRPRTRSVEKHLGIWAYLRFRDVMNAEE